MNILQNSPIQTTVCREIWNYFYWYFGSVARGEQHEESGFGCFVELKDPDPLLCLILKKNWNVYVTAK